MRTTDPVRVYKVHAGAARIAADLCDGSERGEYVGQDYILHTLGQKPRAINLMYCYYPNEEKWPARVSEAYADKDVKFAWDYPYDDYFPYGGGLGGSRDADVFRQMREIRSHGMDVILTLTVDPKVSDEHLRAIGRDLRTFGRIELRLNHECTGNWFSFTKRASYKELGDFFVHAGNIIREEAPNVKMIICAGAVEDLNDGKVEKEEEFKEAALSADIWSMDKYLALHWGWPFDIAEKGGNSFVRYSVKEVYEKAKATYKRYTELNGGVAKPFVLAEFNADGDVTGPYDQVGMIKEYMDLLLNDDEHWLSGFTFYQFRDRGRLGLEVEDPNNKYVGIPQPVMDYYKDLIKRPEFLPVITEEETIVANDVGDILDSVTLRFGGAQDAEAIAMEFELEDAPVFFELYFDENEGLLNTNFMIEVNGRWFRKAPGTKCVDVMSAFGRTFEKNGRVTVRLYAPPASGENALDKGDDFLNSYTTVKKLPKVRIETAPMAEKK